jgi:hypothetical protein
VVVNKPQQASNQLQALVSKKPASVMPKPQWHAPWKLMRVRSFSIRTEKNDFYLINVSFRSLVDI